MADLEYRYVFLVGIVPALVTLWIRRAVPETEQWHGRANKGPSAATGHRRFVSRRRAAHHDADDPGLRAVADRPLGLHVLVRCSNCATCPTWPPGPTRERNQLVSQALSLLMMSSIAGNFFAAALARVLGYRRAIALLCIVYFVSHGVHLLRVDRDYRQMWFLLPLMGASSGVFALFTMYLPPLFPTLLRTTGAGFCYNIGRIAAAFGTVFFGLFSSGRRLSPRFAIRRLPVRAGRHRRLVSAENRPTNAPASSPSNDRPALNAACHDLQRSVSTPCQQHQQHHHPPPRPSSAQARSAIGPTRPGPRCRRAGQLVEVAGVATDAADNVLVFNRGEHPVIVFDRQGRFLRSWGEGLFMRPHGITIGPDDAVYCVDDSDHTVRKFTPEGRLLLTLGTSGQRLGHRRHDRRLPHDSSRRPGPSICPTNLALASDGTMYVADGYGNARVHRFSPDGRLLGSWGEPGAGPGQFHLPHGIAVDAAGTVWVADRENSRLQLFSPAGEFLGRVDRRGPAV